MRIYEELFIVRPDATDEEIDPLIEQLTTVITSQGGSIIKTDKWGVRKLAYRVDKRNEGYYILMQFNAMPETVHELERRLRVADMVLKFITVRIDEKLKKIEKRRKDREKRAARKPAPQVAQPSLPADPAAVPGAPAAVGLTPGAPMPGAPVAHIPPTQAPAPALAHAGAEKE
ncbi:MAG TPA: 30S ribosomal protein S6 [Bryobacteraceae bacterium]|nr:30S ribosomal protein S6 [Bryobacteraceae bacterium]